MALQNKTEAEAKRVTVNFSDSLDLPKEKVQWTPKGVCLMTKWHFAEGVEVEFAFDHQGQRHCCTGVVVACHPHQNAGHYETVLYFVETPDSKLRKAACACRLAQEDGDLEKDSAPTARRKSRAA